MIKYVVMWYASNGAPLGVQYYEHKKDALAAVSHFVSRDYSVTIQKPTF